MREGQKPHELLSSKEKEAFELCSEILLWSNSPSVIRWPKVLQLHDRATELYKIVSNMDVEHDDRYYKAYEALGALQEDYRRIREDVEADIKGFKKVEVVMDVAKDTPEELLVMLKRHLDSGITRIQLRQNYPTPMPYGDWVELTLYKKLKPTVEEEDMAERTHKPDRYDFTVNEMFDHSTYQEPYSFKYVREAVSDYLKRPFEEIGDYGVHLHDFGGPEFWIKFADVSWEEFEERFRLVFDAMKQHPRQLKNK